MIKETKLEKILRPYFPFGFPVSRKIWEDLEIDKIVGPVSEEKPAAGVSAFRALADAASRKVLSRSHTTEPIHTGRLLSLSVICDILRYVINVYCQDEYPKILPRGWETIKKKRDSGTVELPPPAFVDLFPPQPIYSNLTDRDKFLAGATNVTDNRQTVFSEMILLSLAMENPAFRPFRILFDDSDLRRQTPYKPLILGLEQYFEDQPVFSALDLKLFQCLRAPMRAAPDSLEGQLQYIKQFWARFLPRELLEQLLLATDIMQEENRLRGHGPGEAPVLRFGPGAFGDLSYPEPAAFSRDADWMSNVVLIAKSVYVWLDQLSKKYQRHIKYLSDIPDEELDLLGRWGFSGLWLIGVWERSPASQKIKQMMGNPEAAASAYSLYDYIIASDLGGEEAYQNLRERAWRRGLRLASDMVPNHMGIYSRWMIEHPDWFIQNSQPPFPWYSFTCEDLSFDDRVGLQIEDGYWKKNDAAVVFKRFDKHTGDERFIYHGNDGTSMPWNDTAQLNFLIPEVREAVVQTILHVARKFSIIRFDAAMTLAKKHYQRLWFPLPGDGGAIPTRSEYGMTRQDFDRAFPKEFWREVVDRVAAEVPDTLLLAEAFWLMEGYFVRTLGMHRVYNSAFMNMLKMEDNAKYRLTVKNVLEFTPEVLKRFVNFMNNPDEMTAVEQFGKGDKYFGVALMMVTMPGLPMFGHGQIEGFTEKYGMEYRRAYWDEPVDWEMVRRHEREIFPLMRRRNLFSGINNFAFYDFNSAAGWVDENVFAYSNRSGDERALIIYNNAYNSTSGWVKRSTAINIGQENKEKLIHRDLGEALGLKNEDNCFYAFRDHRTGLQYLRRGRQLHEEGFFAVLNAYQYHAFLDFNEINDSDGTWAEVERRLDGRGVPSVEESYREVHLEPVLEPYRVLYNDKVLTDILAGENQARLDFENNFRQFVSAAEQFVRCDVDLNEIAAEFKKETDIVLPDKSRKKDDLAQLIDSYDRDDTTIKPLLLAWLTVRHLDKLCEDKTGPAGRISAAARLDDWLLRKVMSSALRKLIGDSEQAYRTVLLVMVLTRHDNWYRRIRRGQTTEAVAALFEDSVGQQFLQLNTFKDEIYFNKEALEKLLTALTLAGLVRLYCEEKLKTADLDLAVERLEKYIRLAEKSGYHRDKFLKNL